MNSWDNWGNISVEDEKLIAQLIFKHTKFLNPKIVEILVKDNNNKKNYFEDLLSVNKVEPEIYVWNNSPVLFPGIRRHVGQAEIAKFKKDRNSKGKNALRLDDNSFPKMIWAFLMTGNKFTVNNSPKGHSLAHLIDHKDYRHKRDIDVKDYKKRKIANSYASMFTSVTNTIYINNSLMKPTDFNGNIRKQLIQRINNIYSNVCEILPYDDKLNIDSNLNIENLIEPNFVGDENYINEFLKYRNDFYVQYEK
jgi:hypothetical protein